MSHIRKSRPIRADETSRTQVHSRVRKTSRTYMHMQEQSCIHMNASCIRRPKPTKEGYKRRKEDMRKWLENLGERNTKVVRKKKSQREGNPIQISQSGIIFTISLRSKVDYKKDSQKPLVVSFKNLHHHL